MTKVRAVAGPIVLLGVALLLLMTTLAVPAGAHAGDQSYLYLDVAGEVTVRLEMPFGDILESLDIELARENDEEVVAAIEANADALTAYALDHVELGLPSGERWQLTEPVVEHVTAEYVGVTFLVSVAPDDIPQEIFVALDPFFDEQPGRDALFLIGTDWSRGFIDNEGDHLVRFVANDRAQVVDLGESSQWSNFAASVPIGLDHIRTGVDHILFVVVLLLPSVLVFRERWHPAEGFVASLWRVLKIVSMFTLAHSITFTLAGLGLVPTPSSKIVETIIAASIAVAALHNLRPVIPEKEWMLAFVFGLFHGFGFASLVAELDVGTTTQLVSLVGRNVGIEIGQALVVLLMFPALFMLRRTRAYHPFFTVGSVVLIIASLGWMAERLFDARDITSAVLDSTFAFPRILLGVAALTIAAAVMYRYDDSKDELRATASRQDA